MYKASLVSKCICSIRISQYQILLMTSALSKHNYPLENKDMFMKYTDLITELVFCSPWKLATPSGDYINKWCQSAQAFAMCGKSN